METDARQSHEGANTVGSPIDIGTKPEFPIEADDPVLNRYKATSTPTRRLSAVQWLSLPITSVVFSGAGAAGYEVFHGSPFSIGWDYFTAAAKGGGFGFVAGVLVVIYFVFEKETVLKLGTLENVRSNDRLRLCMIASIGCVTLGAAVGVALCDTQVFGPSVSAFVSAVSALFVAVLLIRRANRVF